MSDVLLQCASADDVPRLSGLQKLMTAKRKAENIFGRSQKSTESSVAEPSEQPRVLSSPLVNRYKEECVRAGVSQQRAVIGLCQMETPFRDFSSCYLGPLGARPLLNALFGMTGICALSLRSCGVDDHCVALLEKAVLSIPRLESLDVGNNDAIRFSGGFILERIASSARFLKTICVDGTNVRKSSSRLIQYFCDRKPLDVN